MQDLKTEIFSIKNDEEFNFNALKAFDFQYNNLAVYKKFVDLLGISISEIKHYAQIPCIPIQFFKNHKIYFDSQDYQHVFYSSGTTGQQRSKHFIADIKLYEKSIIHGFEHLYGTLADYQFVFLLPQHIQPTNSSLLYMWNVFAKYLPAESVYFCSPPFNEFQQVLDKFCSNAKKTILFGVSYSLLAIADKFSAKHSFILMETGGMKGFEKEYTKQELYERFRQSFPNAEIHAEYSMTELLSQAYAKNAYHYYTPPWMRVLIRETNDPLSIADIKKTGGINIIDLANIYSCCFIATQDLGKSYQDNSFEVLGRFDSSEIRGCNLLTVS